MKGNKLTVLTLIGIIVFFIGLMYVASGGTLGSFSEADLTDLNWMLLLILIPISRMWWKFSDNFIGAKEVLLKNWKYPTLVNWKFKIHKTNIRYKDAFEIVGWLFAGIAVFGLGRYLIPHYITTALAAVATFLIVVRSSHGKTRVFYIIGFLPGIVTWVLGFLGFVFIVYLGEFLFVLPVIHWVYSKLDKLRYN